MTGQGTAPSGRMGHGEATLRRGAAVVAEARADFDTLSLRLEARLAGLRSSWVGAGGSAFFVLQQAWVERQTRIVAALDGFEAALLAVERDTAGVDEAQSAAYRLAAGRLG